MDLPLALAIEAAEREYLCTRVENLLHLEGNPYGARVYSNQGMPCFQVKAVSSPMFNRVYADRSQAPEHTIALLRDDVDRVTVWPMIDNTPAFASSIEIAGARLERLKGWTHLQLTSPIEHAVIHPHGFTLETATAHGLVEFAAVHAAGFRVDPVRAMVNQASFSAQVPNERLHVYVLRVEGEVLAGALMYIARNGIAYLGTAATHKSARGRGFHRALISHRIQQAREMGCDRIAATALANSQSRRNLQHAGLNVSHAQALYQMV